MPTCTYHQPFRESLAQLNYEHLIRYLCLLSYSACQTYIPHIYICIKFANLLLLLHIRAMVQVNLVTQKKKKGKHRQRRTQLHADAHAKGQYI